MNTNNDSEKEQYEDIKVELRPSWFIPYVSVTVGIWEGEIEHAVMVIPLEVWLDKNEVKKRIERIMGGECL